MLEGVVSKKKRLNICFSETHNIYNENIIIYLVASGSIFSGVSNRYGLWTVNRDITECLRATATDHKSVYI